MSAPRALLPLVVVLLNTACLEPVEASRDRWGFLTMRAFSNGGTPVVRGTGNFYSASGLSLSLLSPTLCQVLPYDPTAQATQLTTLDAGDFVTFAAAGSTVNANRVLSGTAIRYEMTAGEFLTFAAGDTVRVSVPGAVGGFDPLTVKLRLAEPFTADAVPTVTDNQALNLTWTPPPTPGSLMMVSLRYNSDGPSVRPNSEIFCVFDDDGTGTVPAASAQAYLSSEPETRSSLFTRVREGYVSLDSRTFTLIRSNFEFPTPTLAVPSPLRETP